MKPTKVPAIRVYADELTVEVDGVTYRPHAGEWVELLAAPTVSDTLLQIRLGQFQEQLSERSADNALALANEMQELLDAITVRILRRVRAWNWTDWDGTPLPNPPTEEAVRNLSLEEFLWLLTAQPPASPKGSSPSSGTSQESQEQERPKRGSSAASAKSSTARQT